MQRIQKDRRINEFDDEKEKTFTNLKHVLCTLFIHVGKLLYRFREKLHLITLKMSCGLIRK